MPLERVSIVSLSETFLLPFLFLTYRNAKYYNVGFVEGGKKVEVEDVAWYYPEPKEKAKQIEGYVAFYKVRVLYLDQGSRSNFLFQNKVVIEDDQ